MRVLILGITGMLGSAMFRVLREHTDLDVWGSARSCPAVFKENVDQILVGLDVLDADALSAAFEQVRPEVVINCIGLIKQLANANDPLAVLPINAMLPHRLARLCGLVGARLVHVSTDCVFSGKQGHYLETDSSDADDLYGKSKFIGEVVDASHAVTLRTSIIGHELNSHHALIDWFLHQSGQVKGYERAIFSGLPTVELARVIRDEVLPRPQLHGLYHVAAEPINKLELLRLVAHEYGKNIDILPDSKVAIDRSLNGERFSAATGYRAPSWPALIAVMHQKR